MSELLDLLYNEPEKIVEAYFKDKDGNPLRLAPYQQEIIKEIIQRKHERFIVTAATQSGKSESIACLLALLAIFYPNERIVNVSYTEPQARIIFERVKAHLIDDSPIVKSLVDLNRSLGKSKEFSKTRMFMKNGTDIRVLSTGTGDTEGTATHLLGFEATILTVDEAASIPDDVFFTKILRMIGARRSTGFPKMLILSSTPSIANWFEDTWNDPNYIRFHIDWRMAVNAGRMDLKTVEEQRRKMTKSQFEVWYEAKFPAMTEDSVFDMDEVHRNVVEQDLNFYGERLLSVDCARFGMDFTVYTLLDRVGEENYRIVDIISNEHKDTMTIAGRIIELMKSHNISSPNVMVDSAGVGGGVYDRLKEQGFTVNSIVAGTKCTNEKIAEMCLNLKAELYFKAKRLFEQDKLKIINKGDLLSELRKMKRDFHSTGKAKIVDPDKSPDFADSLVYGLYAPTSGSFTILGLGAEKKMSVSWGDTN